MFIVTCCFVFNGCEKDENERELLDKVILNSSELEEYIIAGADLQHSLPIFKSRLNQIDFSKLEVTYDANGKKVVHLSPDLACKFRIEEKVQMFNEKKEALQKKFPQFVSFREDKAKKYFQKSIENSVNVIGAFLKLGINISGPKLKGSMDEWYYGAENEVFMMDYLDDWSHNENYVELYILYYEDGTFGTYQNPGATSDSTHISGYVQNGNFYFPQGGSSSPVISLGHTHLNDPDPSEWDINHINTPEGVDRFIYYDWGFTYY